MNRDVLTVIFLTLMCSLVAGSRGLAAPHQSEETSRSPASGGRQQTPANYPASKRLQNPGNGHEYQRIDVSMPWHEAKRLCEQLGGHLATATSAEENRFIYDNFAQDHVCWLGGTDEQQEGRWQWITGEPFEFTNWAGREPNNTGGVEHYVALGNTELLFPKGRVRLYRFGPNWNDHDATGELDEIAIVFPVCEWDSPPPEAAHRLRALPDGDTTEMLRFLEELKEFRPDTSLKTQQLSWRAPQSMRLAAEKILTHEKDASSLACQTALRVLYEDRIGTLGRRLPQQQRENVEALRRFLQARQQQGPCDLDELRMALWAGRVLEHAGAVGLAQEAYESLAAFATARDGEFAQIGQMMRGAARRLGLLGRELQLTGSTGDGSPFDWEQYRGTMVLVTFWSHDNAACQASQPAMLWTYELFHQQGFDVVEVNVDSDPSATRRIEKHEQVPWRVLYDSKSAADQRLAVQYGVLDLPKSFLVDRRGRVVSVDPFAAVLDGLLWEILGYPYTDQFRSPPDAPQGTLSFVEVKSRANRALNQKTFAGPEGNNLAELPAGLQTFGGVRFQIADGIVQFRGKHLPEVPAQIEGIPIGRRFTRLYVLQGTQWGTGGNFVEDGTVIGEYRLHFEDQTLVRIPIVYGETVRDWWNVDNSQPADRAQVAWRGTNASSRAAKIDLRLYLTAWDNPRPEKKVVSIDCVSASSVSAPFCVALTVEEGKPAAAVKPQLITNSIGMKLALIPAGEFLMGSPEGEPGRNRDETQHGVRITAPFFLGVYEVTQGEFERVTGSNPSQFAVPEDELARRRVSGLDTSRFPVERVNWNQALEFCRRLSSLSEERSAGRMYRLPTEAEWEYACRAGMTTPFSFGMRLNRWRANIRTDAQSLNRPSMVGAYPPSAFGLYDMHGNVSEWCADSYAAGDDADSEIEDPPGPQGNVTGERVHRGGNYSVDAGQCRSAKREKSFQTFSPAVLGFRVVMVPADSGASHEGAATTLGPEPATGRRDDAIAELTEAIRLKPDNAEAYYNRGVAYGTKGDTDKAIRYFPRDRYGGVYAYGSKGDRDQAIADFTAAIRLKPDYAEAYNNRGLAYVKNGDTDKALADYTAAIRLKPDDAEAYHNRGFAYGIKADWDKALADYTAAIRLKPDDAQAYCNRGFAYGVKGDRDKEIADCTEAIRLNPDLANAYSNRGVAYVSKGKTDEAIADFTAAIRLKPDYADAYCNRGNAYSIKGDPDRAIADYTEAIRLNPDFAEAYNNRGIDYGLKGDTDKAIADFTEAIRLKPDDGDAYIGRGITYRSKGDKSKADEDFAKAKELGFLSPPAGVVPSMAAQAGARTGVPAENQPQAAAYPASRRVPKPEGLASKTPPPEQPAGDADTRTTLIRRSQGRDWYEVVEPYATIRITNIRVDGQPQRQIRCIPSKQELPIEFDFFISHFKSGNIIQMILGVGTFAETYTLVYQGIPGPQGEVGHYRGTLRIPAEVQESAAEPSETWFGVLLYLTACYHKAQAVQFVKSGSQDALRYQIATVTCDLPAERTPP